VVEILVTPVIAVDSDLGLGLLEPVFFRVGSWPPGQYIMLASS